MSKRKKEYATDVLKREIDERKRTKKSYNSANHKLKQRCLKMSCYRLLERWLSVILAFASIGVYAMGGFELATYTMLWSILLNIPPDNELKQTIKNRTK